MTTTTRFNDAMLSMAFATLFPYEHTMLWMSNANRKLNINARAFVTSRACIWEFGERRSTLMCLCARSKFNSPCVRYASFVSFLVSFLFFFFGNWQTLELCLCAYICVVQAMNRYGAHSQRRKHDGRASPLSPRIATIAIPIAIAIATDAIAIKTKTNKLHRKALYG